LQRVPDGDEVGDLAGDLRFGEVTDRVAAVRASPARASSPRDVIEGEPEILGVF